MPWLDKELVQDEALAESELEDVELLEGSAIEYPTSADLEPEGDYTRMDITEAVDEGVFDDFGADVTAPSTPAVSSAPRALYMSLVNDDGIQATTAIDGALWARAEPAIRAVASRRGYSIDVDTSPGGPAASRNVRSMDDAVEFVAFAT